MLNPVSQNVLNINPDRSQEKSGLPYKQGSVIEAVLTGINKNSANERIATLVTKDNYTFTANADGLVGEVGDTLRFSVEKNGKDGLSLKQLTESRERLDASVKQNKNILVTELFQLKPEQDESREKAAKAVSRIRNQLMYTSGNANQNAVRELLANGVSLEKISLTMLNSMTGEMEKKPPEELPEEAVADMASGSKAKELFGERVNGNKNGSGSASRDALRAGIVRSLNANDLPINKKNCTAMENAWDRLPRSMSAEEITEAMKPSARDSRPVTIDDLYKARHTGGSANEQAMPDDQYRDIEPSVKKVFSEAGVRYDQQHERLAKLFIGNDIPLTAENLAIAEQLREPLRNLSRSFVTDMMAKQIHMGQSPADAPIAVPTDTQYTNTEEMLAKAKRLADEVKRIDPERVDMLISHGMTVSLGNLVGTPGDGANTAAGANVPVTTPEHASQSASYKVTLEQVRVKLTYEAAYRLIGKHLPIESMDLTDTLSALKELERDSATALLKSVGDNTVNAEGQDVDKVGMLADLRSRMQSLASLTSNVFSRVLNGTRDDFTVSNIDASVNEAAVNTAARERILGELDQYSAIPDRRFGDSFNMVRDQFTRLLEGMGIEATDENCRAAAILSRGGVDISEENLVRTKLIDAKIERISDTLHPVIAANMIKEGLNPLDMHVDEVQAYIDKFNDVLGDGLKDKVAGFIAQMDQEGQIDPQTRDGMIAVYRMLNQIQRNGSVAIALSLSGGPTMGNLMEHAKNYTQMRRAGADAALTDVTVHDATTETRTIAGENNIRRILENARSNAIQNLSNEQYTDISDRLQRLDMAETADNILQIAETEDTSDIEMMRGIYHGSRLDSATEHSDPDALRRVLTDHAVTAGDAQISAFAQMTIEEFSAAIRNADIEQTTEAVERRMDTNMREAMKQIEDMVHASPMAVRWMENHDIPVTVGNILALQTNLRDPFMLGKAIDHLVNTPKDGADDAEDIRAVNVDDTDAFSSLVEQIPDTSLEALRRSNPKEIIAGLDKAITEVADNTFDNERLKQIKLVQSAIKVQNYTASPERMQLPMKMNGKIANLNVFVLNEKTLRSDETRVFMSLNTQGLGEVSAYYTIKGDTAEIKLGSSSEEGLARLRENADMLKAYVADAGFEVTKLSFTTGQPRNIAAEEVEGSNPFTGGPFTELAQNAWQV